MKRLLFSFICLTTVFASNLQANSGDDSRVLTQEEQTALLEERSQKEKEKKERLVAEEGEDALDTSQENILQAASDEERVSNAAYYVTTHQGAFHFAIGIPYSGDYVQVEDGSIWKVRAGDRWQVASWFTTDPLIVTKRDNWFTDYAYFLTNTITGQSVAVFCLEAPQYTGFSTKQLTYRYDNAFYLFGADGTVRLTDGSIWQVPGGYETSKWLLGDRMFIGINDQYDSSYAPNLLLNIDADNWVTSSCINGY